MNKRSFAVVKIAFSSIALLILLSCTSIESQRRVTPTNLTIKERFTLNHNAAKCLYDIRSSTYYVQEFNRPYIHFYRQNVLVNTIGGLGIDNASFQKLTDIAIDAEGNLLALDANAKLIRKFNADGKWIANIELREFNQPTKLCVTSENDLIIYDATPKELKLLSSFTGKTMFSFGKFQVENVSHISSSRDYMAVISASEEKTILFSAMGQMLKELPYQLVLDGYQNQYYYANGALQLQGGELIIPLGFNSKDVSLYSSSRTLILLHDKTVITIEPDYRRE